MLLVSKLDVYMLCLLCMLNRHNMTDSTKYNIELLLSISLFDTWNFYIIDATC